MSAGTVISGREEVLACLVGRARSVCGRDVPWEIWLSDIPAEVSDEALFSKLEDCVNGMVCELLYDLSHQDFLDSEESLTEALSDLDELLFG